MKCEIDKIKLHMFIDNELSVDEQVTISKHITGCKSCGEEIDFLISLKSSFSDLNKVKISNDLLIHLAKIEQKKFNLFDFLKELFFLKDIVKIIIQKYHIDSDTEILIHERYPNYIVRWVFFC